MLRPAHHESPMTSGTIRRSRTATTNCDGTSERGAVVSGDMRILLLIAVMFTCAWMGWVVYTQPQLADSEKAPNIVRVSQPGRPAS